MGNHKKTKIIFIVGPTASGKTAVGISLARQLDGEIISCDSMQVYQDIKIASNKPSGEELSTVTHYGIGFVPLTETFDVGQFGQISQRYIDEIFKKNKTPIVVGGTGMYMKVFLDGIFSHDEDPDIRKKLEDELNEKGVQILYNKLEEADAQAAKKIHPNDSRRIIRALEVYYATGRPISQLQKETKGLWGEYDIAIFGLNMKRDELYDRINSRVEKMFEMGLVDEIKTLEGVGLSKTAEAIIGVKGIRKYLSGEYSLGQAKEEMKKNTRRLAKRQLTWFRAENRLEWIDIGRSESAEHIAKRILERISSSA